jgi:hypothetical protein
MSDFEDANWLSKMIDDFQPGLYQHYKGPQYLALCLAREDETDEVVVVYTRLYARPGLPTSTRRLTVWNEEVEYEGRLVPRFAYCGHVTSEQDLGGHSGQAGSRKGLFRWVKENL